MAEKGKVSMLMFRFQIQASHIERSASSVCSRVGFTLHMLAKPGCTLLGMFQQHKLRAIFLLEELTEATLDIAFACACMTTASQSCKLACISGCKCSTVKLVMNRDVA